jgi:hypothetical protein
MKQEIDLVEIVKSSEKSTRGYDNTDPNLREFGSVSSAGNWKKGGS